jgi:phosphonate transport system permease protein
VTAADLRFRRPRPGRRTALTWTLIAAGLLSFGALDDVAGAFSSRGLGAAWDVATAAFTPDLTPGYLRIGLGDALVTLGFAITGMFLASAAGLVMAVVASGVLDDRTGRRRVVAALTRSVLAGLRAMHELVWALLFVSIFGLTAWTGILAIAVPYSGAIGRVMADRLQDVPAAPLAGLRSAGASTLGVFVYGRVPEVAADTIGYLSYRFECAIRSAAVLSFVGLGGLGSRIELALADLRFDRVWTLVYMLVLIIASVDWLTVQARRRITG